MFDTSFVRNVDGLYSQNNTNNVLFRMLPPSTRNNKKSEFNGNGIDHNTIINNYDNSIIGMPVRSYSSTMRNTFQNPLQIRDNNNRDNNRDNKNGANDNSVRARDQMGNIDFNLYDKQTNLNVSSYESSGLAYSDVSNFGSPLLTPLKQSPEYFMSLFVNCLAMDIVTVMNSIVQTKFFCVAPILIVSSLNFVNALFAADIHKNLGSNPRVSLKDPKSSSLDKFFQGKPSEYINSSLARLTQDIKNLTNLQCVNIALVNGTSYHQYATNFNKYCFGTCTSFQITNSNRQLLLHSINSEIKSNIGKQAINTQILNNQRDTLINANINITPEMLAHNNNPNTSNSLFMYNFAVFSLQFKEPFFKQDTKKGIFYDNAKNKKIINFMKRVNTNALAYQDNNVTLIELECNNGTNFGILMDNSNLIKYQELERYISNARLTSFEYIIIPKIKYQTKIKLNETLKRMGLAPLFCDQQNSKLQNQNFSNCIHILEHNIMVKLDDVVKTEDSSNFGNNSTGKVSNNALLIDDKKLKFKANKPFLFYVKTVNNNCINLAGRFC